MVRPIAEKRLFLTNASQTGKINADKKHQLFLAQILYLHGLTFLNGLYESGSH